MTGAWMCMAAVCAGAAAWWWIPAGREPVAVRGRRNASRGGGADGVRGGAGDAAKGMACAGMRDVSDDADDVPDVGLALEMLAAAIGHGSSIPRALEAVGTAWGGAAFGGMMVDVAAALHRGATWQNAWALACAHPRCGRVATTLADTLEPAWRHGSSPLPRIEAAADQLDRDRRRRIEEGAARLGVRMLVPAGVCFLPSFVLIGILPVVASFGAGLFG